MNYRHYLKTFLLLTVLVTFIGCKSKQDKPGAGTGAPQEKAAAPAETPQAKTGSSQDKTDARAAAAHVLSQLETGEFAQIYKESAASFKQIGSETAFVTKFQQTRQNVGALKSPKETSFGTSPDNIHVLVYRMENERFTSDVRLSFERAKNGNLELVGLNRHDEPKKK